MVSLALSLAALSAQPAAAQPQGPPPVMNSGAPPPKVGAYSQPTEQQPGFDSKERDSEEVKTGPLDAEEQAFLARGELSMKTQIGGAVAAGLLGGGLGQAIEGRWYETGWIFTAGEPVFLATGIIGISQCPETRCGGAPRAVALVGFVGYAGLRLWGFFDAVLAPRKHNRRIRALRERAVPRKVVDPFADEYSQSSAAPRLLPYVAPTATGEGATAGLTLRF